jgi:antitoxin ParD1/3/4
MVYIQNAVKLSDNSLRFAAEQIEEGRYATLDAVVEDGVRLLEERAMKLVALRKALIDGEESGEPEELDFDKFVAELNREHRMSQ